MPCYVFFLVFFWNYQNVCISIVSVSEQRKEIDETYAG